MRRCWSWFWRNALTLLVNLLLVLALALIFAWLLPDNAKAEESPGPSPSPTASPTPRPASPQLKEWALHWQRIAQRQKRRLAALRACAALSPPQGLAARPSPTGTSTAWFSAGRSWKHAARRYGVSFRRLLVRIQHPRGSGAERWRPLVRWTWPAHLVNGVILRIRNESGGAEFIWNGGGSGAFGLLQLYPKPSQVWGALSQLRYAFRHKYLPSLRAHGNGWLPWISSTPAY